MPSHTHKHSCVLLPDTRGATELRKPREHSECEHTHTQLMQTQLGLFFWTSFSTLVRPLPCTPFFLLKFLFFVRSLLKLDIRNSFPSFALLQSPSVAIFSSPSPPPPTQVTLWLSLDCCSKTNMLLMLFLQYLPTKPKKIF